MPDTKKLRDTIRRFWSKVRPAAVFLTGVAGLIVAITVVAGAAIYVGGAVNDKWFWQDDEYEKLHSLRAGFTLDYFESVLGPPVFSRPASQGPYRESTFRGREYWVQAISKDGVVELYATTSCDDDFHPSFRIPNSGNRITLRRTHLADAYADPRVQYFTSGATAPPYYYEIGPQGNPTFYKSFIWGIDGACWPQGPAFALHGLLDFGKAESGVYNGYAKNGGQAVRRFREAAIVNTFVETAPGVFLFGPHSLASFHGFQIGPDEILIRTAG